MKKRRNYKKAKKKLIAIKYYLTIKIIILFSKKKRNYKGDIKDNTNLV